MNKNSRSCTKLITFSRRPFKIPMFLEVIQARNIMYGGDREGGRPFIDKDIGEKVGGRVKGLGGRGN